MERLTRLCVRFPRRLFANRDVAGRPRTASPGRGEGGAASRYSTGSAALYG